MLSLTFPVKHQRMQRIEPGREEKVVVEEEDEEKWGSVDRT